MSLKDFNQNNQLQIDAISGPERMDKTALPGKLKLWCLQYGLLPCLMWPLTVLEVPHHQSQDAQEKHHLKKWLGLTLPQ